MRLTRIYTATALKEHHNVSLDAQASHHLLRVLRLKVGDVIALFDGQGHEFLAEITAATKQHAHVFLKETLPTIPAPSLSIHLGQAISRGEKMDYTVQKAVELGVTTITPLFTERGGVKLTTERLENKVSHWQQVAISACEQSGRSDLPIIASPQSLSAWLKLREESCKLILHPGHQKQLKNSSPPNGEVCLLIGCEGGFSAAEIAAAAESGFETITLGPRILRTETAAPAAITAVQCFWGDMG